MIKKLFFVVFSIIFTFSIFVINVSADTNYGSATDNTKTSTFTPTKLETESVYGVNHQIVTGNAVTSGQTYGQYLNVFDMKTDGFSSKLVSWAVATDNAVFSRQTILKAAKDYEAKNPGWIVVAGINADQYWFSFGTKLGVDGSAIYEPAPYYPMITNGDKLFTVTPYANANNIVGFKNDGSVDSFVNPGGGAGSFYLSVLDENGEVVSTFPVNKINENAGSGETSVWCYHFSTRLYNTAITQKVSTTNKLYVVEDAELAYMSLYEDGTNQSYYPTDAWHTNTVFGKGYISNDDLTSYTLDRGQFAIETDNANVKAALSKGVRIKVEQYFQNEEMNKVSEGMGYHAVHRQNGVDLESPGLYDTQHYSRALFGKKADGTYVLITADYVTGLGSYGLNWTECNAVAEYYGVEDMYQMDGGGSVTAMVRQSDGSFKVTNFPKDSGNPLNPREDFSFLFFVIRDPGVRTLDKNVSYCSVKLTKEDISSSATISNIKVKLSDKTYDFDDKELVISGLKEKTEYKLDVSYDITINGVTKKASYSQSFTTKKYVPPVDPIKVKETKKTSITVVKPKTDFSDNISNVYIYLGIDSYFMGNKDEFTISDIREDETYAFRYTYDIYDPLSDTTYHIESDTTNVKTLNYEEPVIESFAESSKSEDLLVISYKYTDPDRVVLTAKLVVNGKDYKDITTRSGTVRLTDLKFTEEIYDIKLVITYQAGEDTKTLESEILHYDEVVHVEPGPSENEPTTEKKKCGKKNAELVTLIITLPTLLAFVLKKKH